MTDATLPGTDATRLMVVEAPRMLEGAGFEVRRPLPYGRLQSIGSFIMLDHIGPASHGPGEAVGAPRHPHAGLETLSYFIEGGGEHRDSLGNHSVTGPGAVQWMRAGRGIVHDEGPHPDVLRDGGAVHMVQLWLDSPAPHRFDAPDYRHLDASEIPLLGAITDPVRMRVIAGRCGATVGPLMTHTEPLLVHLSLAAEAAWQVDLSAAECAVYVLTGTLAFGDDECGDGHLLIGCPRQLRAGSRGAELLILGGPPLAQAPFRHGPFVAGDRDEMVAIVERYQRGEFGDVIA